MQWGSCRLPKRQIELCLDHEQMQAWELSVFSSFAWIGRGLDKIALRGMEEQYELLKLFNILSTVWVSIGP